MKRDDLRAAIKIERAYKGNKNTFTDIDHRPVTDDELVGVVTSDPDLLAKVLAAAGEIVEALGGEWWCALYLPDMNGVCTYESRHHHDGEGCHWMVPADVRRQRET